MKFRDWKDEVTALVREELETELDELSDVDDDLLRECWHAGYKPKEFVKEHVLNGSPKRDEDDFDPRYEL